MFQKAKYGEGRFDFHLDRQKVAAPPLSLLYHQGKLEAQGYQTLLMYHYSLMMLRDYQANLRLRLTVGQA